MKKFEELFDFIDRAEKSRKYPPNTAGGLRTALKLFEVQLNDEERNSIDKFKDNLEQIYQTVYSKNKDFSAGTLAVYKSRVGKVLGDYEKYGVDPTKMNGWSPKTIIRVKKNPGKNLDERDEAIGDKEVVENIGVNTPVGMDRHELTIRPGVRCILIVPSDISEAESKRVKSLLDSLVQ